MLIKADLAEELEIKKTLATRTDAEAKRLCRLLAMPDLSRDPKSPIHELAGRIIKLEDLKNFDLIESPEITDTTISFDIFNFSPDHPARTGSDTYFADNRHILRTHTTVMWYYQLQEPAVREKIKNGEEVGALAHGKVYRRDEIDRNHMNVFHQMDGWYIAPRARKIIGRAELEDILIKIARALFGANIKYKFNPDRFPYTDPSLEMEIEKSGRWVEVVGAGVVHQQVLKNLGVNPEKWNGWAFGMGLERLAILDMELPDIRLLWSTDERVKRQLKLGHKFKGVSKYPPVTRDISFVVPNTFAPNDYFDLIRDLGGDMVEEMKLLDKYEDAEKFGPDKISYTYRIIYRSPDRTLTNEEVNEAQEKIYRQTAEQFGAKLR